MVHKETLPTDQFANVLQTIFQGVIAVTAGIYSVGFVVMNSYFSKFGITDYGFVQARYIAAGLNYFAIHVSIAALITVLFAYFAKSVWLVWPLTFLLLWALLGGATYSVGRQIEEALIVGVNALVVSLLAWQLSSNWMKREGPWYKLFSSYGISQRSLLILQTVGAILLVALSTITWGRSLWPLMGPTLGGGRPASAVLAIKPGEISADYKLIPFQNEDLTAQLPVLFENSDGYVVLIPLGTNTVAARVPRSAVTMVIYAPLGSGGRLISLPKILPASKELGHVPISSSPTPDTSLPSKQ